MKLIKNVMSVDTDVHVLIDLSPYGTNVALYSVLARQREHRKQLFLKYRAFSNDTSSILFYPKNVNLCALNKYKNSTTWSKHLIHFPANRVPLNK